MGPKEPTAGWIANGWKSASKLGRVMSFAGLLRWGVLCVGLICLGCASRGRPQDFTFTPFTDRSFSAVEHPRLYRTRPVRSYTVIGEVTISGEPDEEPDSLEKRLVEAAGKVGAQGVILVETGRRISTVGEAGLRNDLFGGASKRYRAYPPALPIEEESLYLKGMAIRFTHE
ncbi:MAG: hypothetical protein JRH07_11750 [Deltaproteobacteria bacterium]|nr:hypothetical protein [Deltaproteobacteria bacterium]MBW2122506.1 hypothetical protein [Deltaproteobacteria bacterium]